MVSIGDEIGDREIVRELTPGVSWLATETSGGREVVIKRLEEDCLSSGKLHPAIAQRLGRVRELPEKSVANLHGVERDGALTYLVWDWAAGENWAQYVKRRDLDHDQRLRLARELVLAVQSLHLAGIVHGAIHGGNVIVDRGERIWLIDVSPLLWMDEQADVRAVLALLGELFEGEGDIASALKDADAAQMTLAGILELISAPDDERADPQPEQRTRSLGLAVLTILLGIATTLVVWRFVANSSEPPVQAATTR